MARRHSPKTMELFQLDQDQHPSSVTAEQTHLHIGRTAAPENVPFVYTTENNPRTGLYIVTQQEAESRPVDSSSLSLRLGGPQVSASHPGPFHDTFLHVPGAGSCCAARGNDSKPEYVRHFNRQSVPEVEGSARDCALNTSHSQLKRKSPAISLGYERGSSSRFCTTGSSSNPSEFHPEKRASDYRNHASSSTELHLYRGGNLSIGNEDSSRNVRSRTRLDLDPSFRQGYLPSSSSHHGYSKAHQPNGPGRIEAAFQRANMTTYSNNVGVSPLTHSRYATAGNIGSRHGINRHSLGESATDAGGYRHEPTNRRHPVSSMQNFRGSHGQPVREGHGYYTQRRAPWYSIRTSSSQSRQEASVAENAQQNTADIYSSRFPRPFPSRGWRNSYRDTRSRTAAERLQPFSNTIYAHNRMGAEAPMVEDGSFFNGSRNMFDPYRDMRLDIDDMSYEELLALGESIGSVNTGVSEDALSGCLKERIYLSDTNNEEASCAICLEEYKCIEKIGKANCGHDYHASCIRRWLSLKNACPICKEPALPDTFKKE